MASLKFTYIFKNFNYIYVCVSMCGYVPFEARGIILTGA